MKVKLKPLDDKTRQAISDNKYPVCLYELNDIHQAMLDDKSAAHYEAYSFAPSEHNRGLMLVEIYRALVELVRDECELPHTVANRVVYQSLRFLKRLRSDYDLKTDSFLARDRKLASNLKDGSCSSITLT